MAPPGSGAVPAPGGRARTDAPARRGRDHATGTARPAPELAVNAADPGAAEENERAGHHIGTTGEADGHPRELAMEPGEQPPHPMAGRIEPERVTLVEQVEPQL